MEVFNLKIYPPLMSSLKTKGKGFIKEGKILKEKEITKNDKLKLFTTFSINRKRRQGKTFLYHQNNEKFCYFHLHYYCTGTFPRED